MAKKKNVFVVKLCRDGRYRNVRRFYMVQSGVKWLGSLRDQKSVEGADYSIDATERM